MKLLLVLVAAAAVCVCSVTAFPASKNTINQQELEIKLKQNFSQILTAWINQSLLPALTSAVQTLAELVAQLSTGLAINGMPGIQIINGKLNIEITPEEWSRQVKAAQSLGELLSGWISQALVPAITGAAQTVAELLAQLTAGVAINGLPGLQQLLGKRNAEEITPEMVQKAAQSLGELLSGWISQALVPAITGAAQTVAELLAQLTAGVAINGLPGLQQLLGKRSAEKMTPEQQLKAAQSLGELLSGWISQALAPAITGAAQTVAELLAQLTAGVAINGLPGLQQLLGKRDVMPEPYFLDTLISSLTQILAEPVTQALQTVADLTAQLTASIAIGGVPAIQALIG